MKTMNHDAAEPRFMPGEAHTGFIPLIQGMNTVDSLQLQRCRRYRTEALQTREDAWDKRLEADIKAGKLEYLRKDARRAKKVGKLKTHL
ncbi:MAG: hypothetical protein OXI24_08115 [Candidatus Poribacteria bacterium]|nr:hypothetical protein [Candidatus Poribacteria bacterium]